MDSMRNKTKCAKAPAKKPSVLKTTSLTDRYPTFESYLQHQINLSERIRKMDDVSKHTKNFHRFVAKEYHGLLKLYRKFYSNNSILSKKLDPVYYTDDYPREGCTVTIEVPSPAGRKGRCWAVSIQAPKDSGGDQPFLSSYLASSSKNALFVAECLITGKKVPRFYHEL